MLPEVEIPTPSVQKDGRSDRGKPGTRVPGAPQRLDWLREVEGATGLQGGLGMGLV